MGEGGEVHALRILLFHNFNASLQTWSYLSFTTNLRGQWDRPHGQERRTRLRGVNVACPGHPGPSDPHASVRQG